MQTARPSRPESMGIGTRVNLVRQKFPVIFIKVMVNGMPRPLVYKNAYAARLQHAQIQQLWPLFQPYRCYQYRETQSRSKYRQLSQLHSTRPLRPSTSLKPGRQTSSDRHPSLSLPNRHVRQKLGKHPQATRPLLSRARQHLG